MIHSNVHHLAALCTAALLFTHNLGAASQEAPAVQLWQPASVSSIMTRWAADVTPSSSRPEYPRPRMVRSNWQNLNGLWDYAITPASDKLTQMPQVDGKILVPFCPESALSGVGKKVGEGNNLWYRTMLNRPADWKGKRVLLHFGAVDWKAELFVNGKAVGTHTGGYTAFTYDLTEYLAKGPAELVVKVWDPTDNPQYSIPRGKQVVNPKGIWYTPVTGIWQTVWMEAVPQTFVDDYDVLTSIDGTVDLNVKVAGAKAGDKVKVQLRSAAVAYDTEHPAGDFIAEATAEVDGNSGKAALEFKLDNPSLWSPDQPYLYGMKISLLRGKKQVDAVEAYTAIRSVTQKKDEAGVNRLALNGNILFQYGPLDQGWWPDGLYTAPTEEAMLFDIRKTKELGFNMLRKHIKVEPARWYYGCDREGILVWQDMPSIGCYKGRGEWGQGADAFGAGSDYWAVNEDIKTNYYKEWGEIIAQLKNYPSIAMWIPFNEAWGQFDTQKVVDFTVAQDPSRLVNAASGGNWIAGAGDIVDSHYYPNPVMRIIDPQKVNLLGEYGGIGRPIEGHTWEIGKKWGYVQFDTESKVTDTYVLYTKDLIDIKQLDGCAAAIYTQTTDVEGEVNGFYTYDREVLKVDAARVREANLSVINAPVKPAEPLVSPFAFHYADPDALQGTDRHLQLYTLRGGDLTMQVTNFGARVISLIAPDRNGVKDDIVVGYSDAERFVHNSGERFLGATVGRVANRIGNGELIIDGTVYQLPLNNNGQSLHGGLTGVDMLPWSVVERSLSSITMKCVLPDGMDGYPGKLTILLTYTLTEDNALDIKYKATTDKTTAVNLSNHAFFNLKGSAGGTILDHVMTIDAHAITPVDSYLIPTGRLLAVKGTPFDFTTPHVIGERIGENHPQLVCGGGYDHNWVLDLPDSLEGKLHRACHLTEASTGRVLEVWTDQPGLQFYSGNFFDGSYCGKTSKPIGWREALALEAQKWPDATHHSNFPSIILRPGEEYTQHTVYRFSTL